MLNCLRPLVGVAIILYLMGGSAISETTDPEEHHPFQCRLALPGGEASPLAEARFRVTESGKALSYILEVRNLKDITMSHLHAGFKGGTTTAVVWLYPSSPPPKLIPGPFEGVLAEGKITAKDLMGPLRGRPLSALIKEMEAGKTYVNIHTKEYPEGSICGQVEFSPR